MNKPKLQICIVKSIKTIHRFEFLTHRIHTLEMSYTLSVGVNLNTYTHLRLSKR